MSGLYRRLLRIYPPAFRRRYQAELVAAFEADRGHPRYAGTRGAIRFWMHIGLDLLTSAYRVRRGWGPRPPAVHAGRRSAMEALAQDLRYACRHLRRRPGFTSVAVLSLALGIGGNATIFAFVDGFVFHPFAYPDPDRVVTVGATFPRVSDEERFIEAISAPEFLDIRRARSLGAIAAFDLGNRNVSGGDRPERVFTALALTDLFGPFGLAPALGRGFTAQELGPGGPAAAIISYRLWQSRFGSDPTIVGRTMRVNGVPTTVVGVMPRDLLVLGTDLWIPYGVDLTDWPRNRRPFTLIARLAPGATLAQANAELRAIASQTMAEYERAYEEYRGWRLAALPWTQALMRDVRPAMQLLLGAVALVLLIACANLSNLLLARSTTRQRELAVRLALGAGATGIARHLVAEVVVLAAAGGALGLLMAYAALPVVISLVPAEANTIGVSASINARVLAWTAAITVGSAVLVALLPVVQFGRARPHETLMGEGRTTTAGRAPLRLRHSLIVSEIALSVVLLVGAGLLVRSFANLQNVEPGFDPRNVLTMRLTLPSEKYQGHAVNDFFQQIVDRLAVTPGVRRAAASTQFPLRAAISTPFRLERVAAPPDTLPTTLVTGASVEYFATLGVSLLEGRGFTDQDRANTPLVAVVNRAFASRYLPGVAAVGQPIVLGPSDRPIGRMEIVGVVADAHNRDLRMPPAPELFVPLRQQTLNNQLFLLVRTERDAAAMLPAVRAEIAALDPDQPVYAISTLEDTIGANLFRNRFSMILFIVFAIVALALAALGIYGVMSYAVSARTQEIGLRLAVGADRMDVLGLVLRQVLRMTTIGLTLGLAGAVAAGRGLGRALFEVGSLDPLTMASATVILGAVAVVAGWLPAWRASRVDPVKALRYE